MAPNAVGRLLDAECHGHAMAGAARFPLVHLLHGERLSAGACGIELVMAVAAVITLPDMHFVAEQYALHIHCGGELKFDRAWPVAFHTTAGDREGGIALVTGAARFPLLHFRHGNAPVPGPGNEQLVVALSATVQADMKLVAEDGG